MARSAAPRAPRFVAAVLAAAFAVTALRVASSAFLPAARPLPRHQQLVAGGAAAAVASLGAAAPSSAEEAEAVASLGAAAPASAEAAPASAVAAEAVASLGAAAPASAPEGLLNFGKIPLGGGFAINLDIPETGIVNIAVLIGGLLYLLAPLLGESMSTREKEIQTDIDDAIAKYNEATARLAEAEKAKAQADQVITEINASIEQDKKEFVDTLQSQTSITMDKQAVAAEATLKALAANAETRVESFIQEEAVRRGLKELTNLKKSQKSKFLEQAIESL